MNYTTYRFVVEAADAAVREKNMTPAPVEFREIRISKSRLNRLLFEKKVQKKLKSLSNKIKRRFAR